MSENAIMLAIRPCYADKIFNGSKTVELRRVRPRNIHKGDLVLIYVSSPVKSLTGAFIIDDIIEKPLKELWKNVKERAGVTRKEFYSYYKGIAMGIGISFSECWQLPNPIELEHLKKQINDFCPPQNFRYARENELTEVKAFVKTAKAKTEKRQKQQQLI